MKSSIKQQDENGEKLGTIIVTAAGATKGETLIAKEKGHFPIQMYLIL
jgi:hypothetical protein